MSDEHGGGSDSSARSTSAVQGTVTKFSSLADGTLRLQIDVHHGDTPNAKSLLCDVGAVVAVARLREVDWREEEPPPSDAGEPAKPEGNGGKDPLTGTIMAHFYRTGFFQSPKVLKVMGLDAEFLQWCRRQVCWHCGKQDYSDTGDEAGDPVSGRFFVQAAHVRRIAQGSGTSIKPSYSAIPLCSKCHSIQHAVGESGLAPPEWWETKAADARQEWGHMKLREVFAVDSLSRGVAAEVLCAWLYKNDLHRYLPAKVRRDVEQRQREAAPGSAGGVGAAAVVER